MSEEEVTANMGADELSNGSPPANNIRALINDIADLREEAKRDHHLDLPIPGTKNLLWARYRPFPVAKTEKKTDELRAAANRGQPVLLAASCDTLADACEQIMVLPPGFEGNPGEDGENLVPIDDTVPIGFEIRLVELFVKDEDERRMISTARQVVLAMFPTEQAVLAQNIQVSQWMQDVTRSTDANLLGE